MIFFITFTLFICIVCKEINKKTSIPYASLILLYGLLLAFVPSHNIFGESVQAVLKMGPEELYYIFIPILIFEQGYNSDLFLLINKISAKFNRNLVISFPRSSYLQCSFRIYAFTSWFWPKCRYNWTNDDRSFARLN